MTDGNVPNAALLERLDASGRWFAARKTAPVWARPLEEDTAVETPEGIVKGRAGDVLCRGPAGEHWPQGRESLEAKYVASDEVDAEGFRRYDPDPAAARVMACPLPEAVEIENPFGRMQGAAGDYLVKPWAQRAEVYASDVWIVARVTFEQTYERMEGAA